MSTRPETYSVGGNSVADMLENNMDSSPREEDVPFIYNLVNSLDIEF